MLSTQTATRRHPGFVKRLLTVLLITLIAMLVAGMTVWGTLFLWLSNVPSAPLRVGTAGLFAIGTIGSFAAADGLNELVRSMDQALAPDDLEARLARFDMTLERAQLRGQSVVNRAFLLGAALVVIIFGLSVAMVLIVRQLRPATK